MGAFAAVARGSRRRAAADHAPLRARRTSPGPLLGFVGKAVTFDSGGISIKPAAQMHEMKFDMSRRRGGAGGGRRDRGGSGCPCGWSRVIGATENLPSGHAIKPGDIVRAKSGVTIEINNTDAEGRLVLADCLAHAIELRRRAPGRPRDADRRHRRRARRALRGPVRQRRRVGGADLAAGERTGERVWRMPLHPHYAKLIKGRYADIVNSVEDRGARRSPPPSSCTASRATCRGRTSTSPACAYDNGRPYTPKGGAGWGVRLLVELARASGGRAGHALRTPVDRRRVRRGSGPLAMRRTYVRDSTVYAGRNGRRAVALWAVLFAAYGLTLALGVADCGTLRGPSRTTSRSPPRRPAASPGAAGPGHRLPADRRARLGRRRHDGGPASSWPAWRRSASSRARRLPGWWSRSRGRPAPRSSSASRRPRSRTRWACIRR